MVPNQAIRVLVGMLESQSRDERGGAVMMLGVLGPQASDAFPALLKLLMVESEYEFCQHVGNVIQTNRTRESARLRRIPPACRDRID